MIEKRQLSWVAFGVLMTTASASAFAQSLPNIVPDPPARAVFNDNSVNLTTGQIGFSAPDLSMGNGSAKLEHIREWVQSGFRDNFVISLFHTATTAKLSLDRSAKSYTMTNGLFVNDQGDGSTIDVNDPSGWYFYHGRDGTLIRFSKTIPGKSFYYAAVTGIGIVSPIPMGEWLSSHTRQRFITPK